MNKDIYIKEIACPLFVPIIEEGLENSRIAKEIVRLYLKPIINANIDTLILGCTHYPIIKKQLSNILPDKIKYITSGQPVGESLKKYLLKNTQLNDDTLSKVDFYVSDSPEKFQKLGSKFLTREIADIQLVQI